MAFDYLRPKPKTRITSAWGNQLVDALNMLYGKFKVTVTYDDLSHLGYDIIPDQDAKRSLGSELYGWLNIYGHYGYFKENVYVQGKAVIKDGDPIKISGFIEGAKAELERFYNLISELNAKIERTLLQLEDGALAIDTRFAQRIEKGYAFSASHRFEDVANGATVESWFENPSTSNRRINIVAIEVVGLGSGWIDIYRDNVRISLGSSLPIMNLKMGSGIESKALVAYGGSYTPGKRAHSTVLPGGIKINAIGSLAEVGERVIIPPGYNLLVRITNRAGTATDYSIRYLWWEDELPPRIVNASGIDPNDPTWMPAGGWDKIWEFETDAELTDFATDQQYASVSDHRVVFEPPSGSYGYIERDITDGGISKVAICLKDIVSSVTDIHMVAGVDVIVDGNLYSVSIYTVAGDPSKLELYDEVSGTSVHFTNPGDWIVLVVDLVNKIARVYDRNKNVLAEVTLSPSSTTQTGYWVYVEEDNESDYTIDDVEVDWIAIKY